MKGTVRLLIGIVLGAGAAAVVALSPSVSVGQVPPAPATAPAQAPAPAPPRPVAVAQYCTDTGDFNNTSALDGLVRKAGAQGWELVGVYRANTLGATKVDYVCFKRPR